MRAGHGRSPPAAWDRKHPVRPGAATEVLKLTIPSFSGTVGGLENLEELMSYPSS